MAFVFDKGHRALEVFYISKEMNMYLTSNPKIYFVVLLCILIVGCASGGFDV